jgi:hypothetical protein
MPNRFAIWVASVSTFAAFACASPKKQPGAMATGDLPPETIDRPAVPEETTGDGSPDSPGKLPMAEVEKHMGQVRQSVKECADVTTYEGKAQAKVTITPDGKATAVMQDSSGEPKIDECVVQAFVGVKFPSSERGQHFFYSFTF